MRALGPGAPGVAVLPRGGSDGRDHRSVSPGGVPKRPMRAARVTALGLQGDGHRAREQHGGPDRALC